MWWAALALLPSNVVAWAWWGWGGVVANGEHFLPIGISCCSFWLFLSFGAWAALSRPPE